MKAENIVISSLTNSGDCMDAIDSIEMDKKNYSCTDREWSQGYQTNLKVSAQRKIDAITRKLHSFPDGEE